LLKICNPKIKNRSALLRLLKWKKVLPQVLTAVIAALGGTAVKMLEKVAF
jgi:glycerol uptake facilitator-like aquaporin